MSIEATRVLAKQQVFAQHVRLGNYLQLTHLFRPPPPPHAMSLRFGTKGLSISFVSTESDAKKLEEVQSRFEVDIPELPDTIETSTYMQAAT